MAAIGLGVFGVGGMGDAMWHSIFGVETSIDALLSPTHLVLLAGVLLILTAPMRAVAAAHPERRLAKGEFLPVGLSAGLTTLLVVFFFMYAYAPNSGIVTVPYTPGGSGEFEAAFGVLEIVTTSMILVGSVLFLSSRWRVPIGTFTMMFGAIGVLLEAMLSEFGAPWTVLAPLSGGVTADLIVSRLGPHPADRRGWYLFGGAVPAVMWSVHIAAHQRFSTIGWTPELWAGAIGVATLAGVGLAALTSVTRTTPDKDPTGDDHRLRRVQRV